jgi:hypothetical protein
MPPLTAFKCDPIETAVDQSGGLEHRHPATSGTAKFRLKYNEKFSKLHSSKSELLSTYQLNQLNSTAGDAVDKYLQRWQLQKPRSLTG